MYNSFAVGTPLIWDGSGVDPVAAVNCYSTVADTEVITEGEIKVLAEDAMQGAVALKNMSDLEGFYATEGYPAIKAIGNLLGDVDGDWNCNSTDVTALRKLLLGVATVGLTDINGDGNDDVRDLVNLKKRCAKLAANSDSYQLVWFDDFAGNALNEANWTQKPCASYANDVFYTYEDSNVKLASGDLNLTSFKNSYYDPEGDTLYKRSEYLVPGSVQTENKMSYKYGYLEIRAKVPYKEGAWPAFWLRSSNATGKNYDAPYELEVDVFEVFGSKDTMRSNLHQHFTNKTEEVDENGDPIIEHRDMQTIGEAISQAEGHTFTNSADLFNEYHTYGFEWSEDRMAIYVDRELQCEWFLDAESLAAYGLDPDTTGFDTTLNVIFGNNLITPKTEGFSLSQKIEGNEENLSIEFDIDWIRLYQKNDGLSELYIGY
jgi:beta-glucanase (GH16 family)